MLHDDPQTPAAPGLPAKGWKTYTVGVLTIVSAMLAGVDWNVVFSGKYAPELAAAAGGGVLFARALVSLFRAIGEAK